MPLRSSWKGYLKLSLVSVPVEAFSAGTSAGTVPLHQLHAECHSRIRYQKTCPLHGEVSKEEIVKGYEYAKGQYVVIDTDELKQLRTESDDAISVDAVVGQGEINDLYLTDRTYYLLPSGAVGQKPYALIQQSLAEDDLQAVARVVLFGRDQLVVVRPIDRLLAMTALKYDAEVLKPEALRDELEAHPKLEAEEVTLTRTLLKSFHRKKFSLAVYKDEYVEKLTKLIDAKVEGKELVTPPPAESPRVINLMDALKKSLAQAAHDGKGETAERRGKRKMVPSSRGRSAPAAKPRRKSG